MINENEQKFTLLYVISSGGGDDDDNNNNIVNLFRGGNISPLVPNVIFLLLLFYCYKSYVGTIIIIK